MKTTVLRSIGFALPILFLATALHLEKDPSWGSGLDGILSGAWFTGLAALGAWARARRTGSDRRLAPREAAPDLALGAGFGVVTWLVLWAVWQVPGAQLLVGSAFALNSVVFLLAGMAGRPEARSARRAEA